LMVNKKTSGKNSRPAGCADRNSSRTPADFRD